jgi:hypothetical protein
MTRYLIVIIGLILLISTACDRFEHSFSPQTEVDFEADFFSPLRAAFTQITATDLSAIEAMYTEDYIHNGITKANRINWIGSFLSEAGTVFEVQNTAGQSVDADNALVNWNLVISRGGDVLADSTFIGEAIRREGDMWRLKGNNVCIPNFGKQLVIAEYFTFRTCPNCPPSEAKLYALQNQYPDNFLYLEHHVTMELAVPGDNTHMYYQAWSQPSAVFQGEEKVNGSADANLSQYQSIVDQLVTVDEPISYQIISSSVNGNELSGTVRLTPKIQLDDTDLVLNYVIISDEDFYTNVAGEPLHNVVRAKGSHSIEGVDLNLDIPFSLSTAGAFPDEYTLVIFAQTKPTSFQNNATIYGGIKHTFTQPVRRR